MSLGRMDRVLKEFGQKEAFVRLSLEREKLIEGY